jgi:hypothetical protein
MDYLIITHTFFPEGAIAFQLSDKTTVFIYPGDNGTFQAWYTGMEIDKMSAFLSECADGMHDSLGSGFCDTWAEIIKQLKDFV